mgnify:CR=1 FL=1
MWQKLSHKIKALERNVSLSGGYLEQLSVQYKKQIEDLQLAVRQSGEALAAASGARGRSERSSTAAAAQERVVSGGSATAAAATASSKKFGCILVLAHRTSLRAALGPARSAAHAGQPAAHAAMCLTPLVMPAGGGPAAACAAIAPPRQRASAGRAGLAAAFRPAWGDGSGRSPRSRHAWQRA